MGHGLNLCLLYLIVGPYITLCTLFLLCSSLLLLLFSFITFVYVVGLCVSIEFGAYNLQFCIKFQRFCVHANRFSFVLFILCSAFFYIFFVSFCLNSCGID